MLFYVKTGKHQKLLLRYMNYLIFQKTKIYFFGEYIPIKNIGTSLSLRQKVCIPRKHCSEHHLNMAADIDEQHKL